MKFLPLIFKNAFRKKTRTLLTLGSILLPLFVICILGTLVAVLETDPTEGRGMWRLVTRHKVSITNWLVDAHTAKIRQLPGVAEVVRNQWFGGQYVDASAFNNFSRFSTQDPEALLRVFDEAKIVEGSGDEWVRDRTGVLVGRLLMNKYGWRLGQKIALKGDIYPVNLELTIRAVFQGPDESSVYFHHTYLEEALPRVKGFVGWFWIKADSPQSAEKLPKLVDDLFENSSYPTRTETEKEFQNTWVSMLGNVKLLLTSISVIIAFVILLIAGNTMAMAARERVTEIAVLRTLGYQKGTILGLILGESLLLSAVGGLFGLGAFVAVFPFLKRGLLYSPMAGFAAGMKIFWGVLIAAFAVTLLVGLFAGLVPAIRSSQRSITDGLRQVV
jgi:putative ABC transport system permease protein